MYLIGNLYNNRKQHQPALEYYQQTATLAESLGQQQNLANAQYMLGECYRNLEQKEAAISGYEQAVELYLKLGIKDWAVKALASIGSLCRSLKRYEEAIQVQEQRLGLVRELNDRVSEQSCLYSIGCIWNNRKEYQQAIEYLEQALNLAIELNDENKRANAYYMLAQCHKNLEKFKLAEDSAKSAKYLYQLIENTEWVINSQDLLHELTALTLIDETKKQYKIATGDYFIEEGIQLLKAKNTITAISMFEQGLNVYQENRNPSGQANALGNLGSVYRELRLFEKSVDCLSQAITLERENKNRVMEAFYTSSLNCRRQSSNLKTKFDFKTRKN
ncbi:MAG: tetratricopeptide repeat protein [Desertifilum sp. SIO1I2]|nr:tetratricopeptide repeat protein [Desertifilum sp. SIO1I2]